jgi:hypothetical protein
MSLALKKIGNFISNYHKIMPSLPMLNKFKSEIGIWARSAIALSFTCYKAQSNVIMKVSRFTVDVFNNIAIPMKQLGNINSNSSHVPGKRKKLKKLPLRSYIFYATQSSTICLAQNN